MDTTFDQIPPSHTLVLGDIMLDRHIHGQITRISPEAPVPVFRHKYATHTLGGAGNVAANIVSLGGNATLLSVSGADDQRPLLTHICEDYGVEPSGIVPSSCRKTTTKTRFVVGGQQVIRYDEEDDSPLADEEHAVLATLIKKHASQAGCIVLSDYGKGIFHGPLGQSLIRSCTALGKPVIVDPKGNDFSRYSGATGITPNLKELSAAVGRKLHDDDEVVDACRELIDRFGFDFVLATRSEKGMSLVERDTATHLTARAREVFDVSGAGDTVVATLAVGLASGSSLQAAARMSNVAGGLAVQRRGTARISREELRSEMARQHIPGTVMPSFSSLSQALQTRSQWKAEGLKVGFTNGCFDILHAGHASMLERAREHCDRLVVGLNSDGSVSRLKGPSRPVNTVHDRAMLLASLRSVDAVVVFDDDTPLALIETLQPDVLFKGADYTLDTVVGAHSVQANGGEVILLDLVEGRSTTETIRKIKT